MTGRSCVLFVDDDVVRLSSLVAHALRHLRSTGQPVASSSLEYFPDNTRASRPP
jgi:hypothetical protein